LFILQDSTARIAELESTNKRVVQELADFKAESKELRNQDLTIKRLEAQLGQMKAQLQNKVSHLFTLLVCALQSTQRIATVYPCLCCNPFFSLQTLFAA
jgi:septal ring factor EnvC (AmiA/AmiB activator)